jgi:small subunit ribosomal protein S17e
MGRIKTQLIKRISNKLFAEHKTEFKTDFNENKEVVAKLASIPSKKIRNIIAGYVTRLMQTKED